MKIVISVQQLMKHIIAGEKNQLEQIKKPYLRLNLNGSIIYPVDDLSM